MKQILGQESHTWVQHYCSPGSVYLGIRENGLSIAETPDIVRNDKADDALKARGRSRIPLTRIDFSHL